MKSEYIDKKVNAVMESADNMHKAEPRPFLFTRLEARMKDEKSFWWKMASFFAKPSVAFTCICLIIIINTMVIFFANKTYKNNSAQQGSELAIADEYNLASTPAYDFESSKP